MTTDDKISCRNRDNFAQQIPMQFSHEPKLFSESFFAYLKSTSNFHYLEKTEESQSLGTSEIINSERGSYMNF